MATMRSAPPEDDFLPPGYEAPQSGKYFRPSKLPAGETRFRILAKPLIGSQGWVQKGNKSSAINKPMGEEFTEEGIKDISHMWWLPVYDYRTASVMLAQISQQSIQRKIESLAKSPEWGSPFEYDLILTKEGSGMDTEYEVMPCKPKSLEPAAVEAWQKVLTAGFNMARIFTGDDPFEKSKNGGGPTSFDAAAADPSSARKRFFSVLGEAVKAELYGPSIKVHSESGRLERRKLLRALLGGDPDPATLSFTGWDMAATKLADVIEKNRPPTEASPDPDADIPF